jgi:putative transposase
LNGFIVIRDITMLRTSAMLRFTVRLFNGNLRFRWGGMEYRRARTSGGTYFFTVVTHNRRKFLCDPDNVVLLRSVIKNVMLLHPFIINAMVVMPDHIHALWTLPDDDNNYSIRWSLIKSGFTRSCDDNCKGVLSSSCIARKRQAVWQNRFWEHEIRDDLDFVNHVEYIHYNPVKHGLVKRSLDWEYSSFHQYVKNGLYSSDWGNGMDISFPDAIGGE